MKSNSPPPSYWRSSDEWTLWDRLLFRTGIGCVVMGVLAHILPLFGLQFRKLNHLGSSSTAAGTGVACVGVFLILYVLFLKGRTLKIILGLAGVAVIGLVTLLTIGYLSSNRNPTFPVGPPSPMGGPPAPFAGPPAPFQPPQFTPPPKVDYASLVTRYGEGRVARVTFTDTTGLDIGATVRDRLKKWNGADKPSTWSVSNQKEQSVLLIAPVSSLDDLATKLDMGSVTGTDMTTRLLTIRPDIARCIPAK